ncbi:TPA: hypothetical protein SMM93_001437 [Proteus mirabilis]
MSVVQYYVDAESVNMETELCEITDDEKYTLEDAIYDKDADELSINVLVNECASDYHSEHDGNEYSWPVFFIIWVDSECKGQFIVNRELDPVFSAKKVDR